jgi:hypothetical protein
MGSDLNGTARKSGHRFIPATLEVIQPIFYTVENL